MTDIIDRLKEPDAHYPGNFDTPKRANAMLSCLCQEAMEEITTLRRELENARARDIHSCGPDCTRSGCVNRRLREELAEKDAEIERLKGDTYAGLDVYPNNTESEQQRKLVGSVEMGQLLERGKDEGAGNTKTQGVIVLAGIDEYGPILRWYTHWVDFEVGSEFYSDQQLAASQAVNQQLREALIVCVCAMQDYQAGIGITEMFDKGENLGRLALQSVAQDTTALEAMIAKAGEVMRERCESTLETIGAEDNCYGGAHAIRALPAVTLHDLK